MNQPTKQTKNEPSFYVQVQDDIHSIEPDWLELSMTHNGYQWTTIRFAKSEARQIIEAIEQAL